MINVINFLHLPAVFSNDFGGFDLIRGDVQLVWWGVGG